MLTQEEIDSFHKNGFLIMRNLIKGTELEILQRAADTVQAMGANHVGADHRYATFKGDLKVYWRSEKNCSRNVELYLLK